MKLYREVKALPTEYVEDSFIIKRDGVYELRLEPIEITEEEINDIGEQAWRECGTVAPANCQLYPFMEVYHIAAKAILSKLTGE